MRAGGLTDEAQADGIVFVRNTDRLTHDGRSLVPDALDPDSVMSDSLTLIQVMKGRIGLDLNEALRNPRSADNLVLEDGDQIIIPRFNAVVRVQGAVNAPSNVAYIPGRDLNYYVDAAGGPSRTGDKGHAYVTQPSGRLESVHERTLLPDGVPVPRRGAVVTVPEKAASDKNDWIGLATVFAQVVASLATIVVITRR
jgi:protein involved in polysaccharide export with SLBB domain